MLYNKEVIKTHFTYCDNFIKNQLEKFIKGKFKEWNYPNDIIAFKCFCLQYTDENYLNKLEKALSIEELTEIAGSLNELYLFDNKEEYNKYFEGKELQDKRIDFLAIHV